MSKTEERSGAILYFAEAKALVRRRFEAAYFGRLVGECGSVREAADVSRTDRPQIRRYLRRNGLPRPRRDMTVDDLAAVAAFGDEAAAAAWAAHGGRYASEFEEVAVEERDRWRGVAAAVLGASAPR